MRIFLLSALLSALLFLISACSVFADDSKLYNLVNYSVVKVKAGNFGGTGTLFWKSDDGKYGYVITCKHVIGNQKEASATWRSGYSSSGPILGLGVRFDTAIFVVDPPDDATVIPISKELVKEGDIVDAFGYGGQYDINVKNIKLIRWTSEVTGYNSSSKLLVLKRPLAVSGDSGGPIVYKGRIIGLVQGGQQASYNGPAINTHGPFSGNIIALIDKTFNTEYQDQCGPNGCTPITVPISTQPQGRYPVPMAPPEPPVVRPVPEPQVVKPVPEPEKTIIVLPDIEIDIPKEMKVGSYTQCDIKGLDVSEDSKYEIIMKVYPKDGTVDIRDGMSFLRRNPYVVIHPTQSGRYDFIFVVLRGTQLTFIEKGFMVKE